MLQLIQAFFLFFVAAILLVASGCESRLASSKKLELDLDSNDIRTFLIDPTPSEQTVSISANTDGPPIDVYVYLSADEEAVDRAITFGTQSDKIIASQLDSTKISLNAKIPADKEASVRLQTASPDKAKVTLIISN